MFLNFIFTVNLHLPRGTFMFYKPKYCCNCGEQIERIEGFPRICRRFCETCETDFKLQEWLPNIFAGFLILFSLFGLGAYLSSGKSEAPIVAKQKTPEVSKSSQESTKAANVAQMPANVPALLSSSSMPQSAVNNQLKSAQQTAKTKQALTDSSPEEIMYFCGAMTKKGTACTHRVKGGGRCWQHKGQPAILPQEKLVASR